jgi:hypothetical protein
VRHGKGLSRKYAGGFSLFEMVVTICSIVILYMVAEERLNQLPAAAERANFYAVLEQIKTGVSFEMVTRLAAGRSGEIRNLEGGNPMEFLIETPRNYEGELESVTDAVERRNAWYFETTTGELVYVVGGASIEDVDVTIGGVPVNLGQIRFKLTNVYSKEDTEALRGTGSTSAAASRRDSGSQRWEALILAPVREYSWERGPQEPVPLD